MGYEFRTMSKERIDAFLAEPRHAVIGLTRKNGSPHLSVVWYKYDEGKIKFLIQTDSIKYKIINRDSRVCVCVDGGFPDVSSVLIDGTATMEEVHEDEVFIDLLSRYYDDERYPKDAAKEGAETYRSWGVLTLVSVTPEKIRAQDFGYWEDSNM